MRLILAACLMAAVPAFAQAPPCAPIDDVTDRLLGRYGEAQQGFGLMPRQGAVVSLYVDQADGSWTLLLIRPDGIGCLIAAGEAWTVARPAAEGL